MTENTPSHEGDLLSRTRHDDTTGESSNSESEYNHALEVIFEAEQIHRRKSSLIPSEAPKIAARKAERRKDTACFVHQLLERERQRKKHAQSGGSTDNLKTLVENNEENQELEQKRVLGDHEAAGQTHSRLLTKRQLSDMAWGVRELSKKLGGIRLKLKVKTVFLLTKAHDEELIRYTRGLAEWLLSKERDTPYIVYVEKTFEHNKRFDVESLLAQDPSYASRLKYWTDELCHTKPNTFDFVITLGGDGTVLYASWLFQRVVPPVLSFALGSLGFLTKFDYDSFPQILTDAFKEGVTVSLRLRFEGTVMRATKREGKDGEVENGEAGPERKKRDLVEELIGEESDDYHTHRADGSHEILNDIVVDRGPCPTMSAIEIFGDDEHFTTVQADGVCVATPTGSTAYNLAAGGSLCHPENPVILVTAICAHTLSFRPIILPDTIVLRLGVPYDARTSCWASFDGRERVELQAGDYVTISASRFPFANVMPRGRRSEDWVNSISRTLQWNSRQRQKSYKKWNQG